MVMILWPRSISCSSATRSAARPMNRRSAIIRPEDKPFLRHFVASESEHEALMMRYPPTDTRQRWGAGAGHDEDLAHTVRRGSQTVARPVLAEERKIMKLSDPGPVRWSWVAIWASAAF